MKTLIARAAAACALLVAVPGFAQDDEATPAAPIPPTVTITVPTCRLAAHAGIQDADAATAGQLVCAELAHAGAPPEARYRVSLGKLGSVIILSVEREGDALGSTIDSREMRLQGIEEVSVAAPRIADSIVHGTPLRETEKVDNLVGDETRQPKTKPGKVHFALGLLGVMPPLDRGAAPSAGLDLDLHYETGSGKLELGGSIRFGGSSGNDNSPSMAFFVFSMGGRYYTTDTDFSPYVGGGLTWGFWSLNLPGVEGFNGNNSGLGAYIDGGVEILRTHHTHLALGARLDAPFFALNNQEGLAVGGTWNGTAVQGSPVTYQSTLYYAPISIEMRLTF